MDVNQIYCGVHFAIYANNESLGYTSETNKVVCELYVKKKIRVNILRGDKYSILKTRKNN